MKPTLAVINAWGTPTPFGVSRSPLDIAAATAQALTEHTDIERVHDAVAAQVTALTGTEAACFCHCAAAGVTLAVAAALTGTDLKRIATLPDVEGTDVVAIQLEHHVNYGQAITQAIRLAGARVLVLTGTPAQRARQITDCAASQQLAAIIAVSSTLVKTPPPITLPELAEFAHKAEVPIIVDAAAQDWRMGDTAWFEGIDLAIFSAQKYLAAPTCGILAGRVHCIEAARSNLTGIGRGMKPTKEALAGVAAALAARDWGALGRLTQANLIRARRFIDACDGLPFTLEVVAGPDYGPYPRIALHCGDVARAMGLADRLRQHEPSIVVGRHAQAQGIITLELTYVSEQEEGILLGALQASSSG